MNLWGKRGYDEKKACRGCGTIDWNHMQNGLCPSCNPELRESIERSREFYADINRKHSAIYFAMRSRVLTDDELKYVESQDYQLLIHRNEGWMTYNEKELKEEFNAALLQQFKLRDIQRGELKKAERREE